VAHHVRARGLLNKKIVEIVLAKGVTAIDNVDAPSGSDVRTAFFRGL
jgi:hypothetical protein